MELDPLLSFAVAHPKVVVGVLLLALIALILWLAEPEPER